MTQSRILLVGDHEFMLESMARVLRDYEATHCQAGEEIPVVGLMTCRIKVAQREKEK